MKTQGTHDTDQPGLQRDPLLPGHTVPRHRRRVRRETLSKADASKRIDELRERSPRLTQE